MTQKFGSVYHVAEAMNTHKSGYCKRQEQVYKTCFNPNIIPQAVHRQAETIYTLITCLINEFHYVKIKFMYTGQVGNQK